MVCSVSAVLLCIFPHACGIINLSIEPFVNQLHSSSINAEMHFAIISLMLLKLIVKKSTTIDVYVKLILNGLRSS